MATKSEKTREHIIDCSYSLFAEYGFKNITMKDVCERTGMSRGGLYSHFPGTAEIFEALIRRMTESGAMDFQTAIKKNIPAVTILNNAFKDMEEELMHPEDSLSIAIYEYATSTDNSIIAELSDRAAKRWRALIRYGIKTGEFRKVNTDEIVNLILYTYQGVRMWSRISPIDKKTYHSLIRNIKRQLIGNPGGIDT